MKLSSEFFRLPIHFDAPRLVAEIEQFGDADWRAHPQGHKGNRSLPLIASSGDVANEDTRGPMRPTPYLACCPYLQQVLAALGAPIGRTRLMRIEGHGEATAHVDTNYYWAQRVRVHIPILTYPGVRFLCGDHEVFMDAGECWIFDTWRNHNVLNPDDRPRIHLVADTVGSDVFWDLVAQADRPHLERASTRETRLIHYQPGQDASLVFESHNFPAVMSPWELRWLSDQICADLSAPADPVALDLQQRNTRFLQRWQSLWAQYGEHVAGRPLFRAELQRFEQNLAELKGRLRLTNQIDPVSAIQHWIIRAAVAPDGVLSAPETPASQDSRAVPVVGSVQREVQPVAPAVAPLRASASLPFDRPIFLVAAPRSGSSLLFETLASAPDVYTVGGESHRIIEGIAALSPIHRGYESNQLMAADATPDIVAQLQQEFGRQLRDREGRPPVNGPVRILEKTPKNALRIGFLAAAFPDARFIYLYREPHESLASMIEAWESGKFVTYPQLPGWQGLPWSLLLIPGWRKLQGKSTAEIATAQWAEANRQILEALAALPHERWYALSYAQFLADPQGQIERLCRFAGLRWDRQIEGQLPLSRHTLTPPDPEKWRARAGAIEPQLAALEEVAQRGRAACEHQVEEPRRITAQAAAPLRSVHTISFPQLLHKLGISILASTYQAGRLVILRADGELLNTHFRNFNKPMGMALDQGRLALGTDLEIREFYDLPAHTRQLTPPDRHDGCFLPRSVSTTGDIQIHEMAWIEQELWFVNTRFSCLCTRDPAYSFVPRWRPPFVSALAPDDRCHLNGLAVVDGKPRYATALGESDLPQGWREHKRDGGILIDICADAIVARGLSMPHSPRWYAGKLWLLNSGVGSIGVVDPQTGRYEEVARLPGFTRGLDFYGRYAFIGLSQVRESAVFSGISIAELPIEQRACGIWVVDITTGQTVAFVRFEDALQEIFAVQVVHGRRFPELVTTERSVIAGAFVLPEAALADVAQ